MKCEDSHLITPVQPHKCLSSIQIEAAIPPDTFILTDALHQHRQSFLVQFIPEQQEAEVSLCIVIIWSLVQNLSEVLFCFLRATCLNITSA